DILVLDVRTAADFIGEQGHIAGAVNLPLEELPERINEISDYQEKPVVTVCRTDRRSVKAVELLAQRGFADVHVVTNGMTGWNENGYPLADA
ncbi:MAG TPA: rhodanese-like domain-containing protein, partial [Gammaproteobacteria bacterium]|nr:rhodanese-like domain-containing protein [Gammaproteobacteria bacterium]